MVSRPALKIKPLKGLAHGHWINRMPSVARSELRPRVRDPATLRAARDRHFAGSIEEISKPAVAQKSRVRDGRFAENCRNLQIANYFSLGWFLKNPAGFLKAL